MTPGSHRERLIRDTSVSFAGYLIPIVAALFCVPILIRGLGTERFGIFSVMAAVVGYAGLFDLGLGRTLGRMIAHRLGAGRTEQVNPLFWTSMAAMAALGMIGMVGLVLLGPPLIERFQVSPTYREESVTAFVLLAVTVPASMFVAGLRNVLHAHGRFRFVGMVGAISGSLNLVGPAIVLHWHTSLVAVAIALVATRLVTLVVYALRTSAVVDDLGLKQGSFDRTTAREVFSFGGWMSVTNVVGPIFFYADRVVLGLQHSATAIAYYTTPYDVMVRLLIVPSAIVDVLFPEFSRKFGGGEVDVRRLYMRSSLALFGLVAPVCLLLGVLAQPLLGWWLGPEFAEEGYRVVQLMSVGVVLNGCARISQALLQSAGRPDWAAWLQLGELLLYVGYMPVLIARYEVIGAAIAWLVRVAISFVALTYLAHVVLSQRAESATNAELR